MSKSKSYSFEFTVSTADALFGGASPEKGVSFTTPLSAGVTVSITDDDKKMAGVEGRKKKVEKGDAAVADVDMNGFAVSTSDLRADATFEVRDEDGKKFKLLEITAADGSRFFTFIGDVPAAGSTLTIGKFKELKGESVKYDKLGAGIDWSLGEDRAVTIEAEDFELFGYKSKKADTASGDRFIKAKKKGGEADLLFGGQDGDYDVTISHLDENDGQGRIELLVNGGIVGVLLLDADDGGRGKKKKEFEFKDGQINSVTLTAGDVVTIRAVRDGKKYALVDKVTFRANTAPVIDGEVDAGEIDQNGGDAVIDLLGQANDPEGGVLTVANVVIVSSNGDRVVVADVDPNGTITIDPAQFADLTDGESETLTITYDVLDDDANATPASATITVNGLNDALDAGGEVNGGVVDQDGGVQSLDLLANASDVDGDVLTVANVAAVSENAGRVVDFTANADGSFDIDPAQFADLTDGESETITITYDVVDEAGVAVSGSATITVEGRNDAPDAGDPVDGGDALRDQGVATVDLLANASDIDGDELTVANLTAVSDNAARVVDFTVNADGTFEIDPAQFTGLGLGDTELVTINFEVVDEAGVAAPGSATITIVGTNTTPTLLDQLFTGLEDEALADQVDAFDPDPGDALTFTLLRGPDNGGFTLNPDGSFEFAPDQDFNGTESFDVRVTDNDNAAATATITLDVAAVNDDPVVTPPAPTPFATLLQTGALSGADNTNDAAEFGSATFGDGRLAALHKAGFGQGTEMVIV